MNQFTVITNTSSPVLYISIGNKATIRLFSELINGNPDNYTIKHLQIASQDFKERLSLLDDIGERIYEMKHFFKLIPTGQHFLFLPGIIEDRILIYLYLKQLSQLDNVPLLTVDLEKIAPYLYDHYKVLTFGGNERRKIGVYNKDRRVCRFCNQSMPNVKFTQKAHAISESLGNKGIICLEECDDCNRRFGNTIERDVVKFFQYFLILKGIKGKNGIPTLQGDGLSITNVPSSRSKLGTNTIVLKVKTMPDTHNPQEIAKYISKQLSFSNIKYIPQNIYKCFCKFVLSVISRDYLPYFKSTIDWINESLTHHQLPPVWYYNVLESSDDPYLVVMIRKHNSKEIPYCWAILNIAGFQFLFILPFCSLDKYKFVGKTRIQFFLDGVREIMPNITLQPMKLNGIASVSLKINANINISPDCLEGRDYYFIEPQNKKTE